jgi:hypothetical protein
MLPIANPIYDVFFKFLMQDETSAQCLLSAILDRDIELLEILPQERVISSSERPELTTIRFDYRVTIRETDGTLKKVLVELQKIKNTPDIARFRRYLGSNYSQPDRVDGQDCSLPIITIYMLGFNLSIHSPVIRAGITYTDAVTGKTVEGTDAFIEALTHNAYFIQLPRLSEEQKTRLERVLAVFSQKWADSHSSQTLRIPDELKNADNAPLIQRLLLANADPVIREQAIEQENFDKGLQQYVQHGIQGVAKKMKTAGFSIEQIIEMTELDQKTIEKL